jgi:predicted DNA-binding transcriptional regulator YafY
MRAFCHTKGEFRDFVLGRIMEVHGEQPSDASAEADEEWNEHIKVIVAPNPDLTVDQKKIIERDYSMKRGKAEIIVRRALLFYLKRRLGVEDGAQKMPAAQQVVIVKVVSTK